MHDQQPVAGWFDVVLDPLPAWCHDPWLTLRLIGAEEPILGGQFAGGAHNDPAIVSTRVDSNPEPLVGLHEHFGVICGVGAESVSQNRVRPPSLVHPGIEQVTVLRPGGPVADVVDFVGQQLLRLKILDSQHEALVTGAISGVGQ